MEKGGQLHASTAFPSNGEEKNTVPVEHYTIRRSVGLQRMSE